jgi:hypothetical protein
MTADYGVLRRAEIEQGSKNEWGYVRYWHLADNPTAPTFVGDWSKSGQVRAVALTR